MNIRTANKRRRRKQQVVPCFKAGRGIWFIPCEQGGTSLINGNEQPSFYRYYGR